MEEAARPLVSFIFFDWLPLGEGMLTMDITGMLNDQMRGILQECRFVEGNQDLLKVLQDLLRDKSSQSVARSSQRC